MPELFWTNCRVLHLPGVGHEIFTVAEGLRKAAGLNPMIFIMMQTTSLVQPLFLTLS